MKTAVIGSRNFGDYTLMVSVLDKMDITGIISGGAKGADSLAKTYAEEREIDFSVFLPQYDKFPGRVAPLMRNIQIVDACEVLVAFWDGKSKGTAHAVKEAKKKGKTVVVIMVEVMVQEKPVARKGIMARRYE